MATHSSSATTAEGADEPPEGVDAAALRGWLADRLPEARGHPDVSLISGGRSNLTYRIGMGDQRWVLRRPPLGHVLATAHDMAREYRILGALQGTSVPVPEVVGICADPAVLGAPFYLMEDVPGHVLRVVADIPRVLPSASCRTAGLDLVSVLARIHDLDVDGIGLGTLGRREDYLGRQLRRWWQQYQDTRTHDLPDVERAYERLLARKPPQRRTALVHGDYKLDNVIVGDDGRVRAVLDWELCALGDPMADVGQLVARSTHGQVEAGVLQEPVVSAPGMPGVDEMVRRYGELAGADVSELDYYVAFALWKGACILQGVYVRMQADVMSRTARMARDEEMLRVLVRERAALAVRLLGAGR